MEADSGGDQRLREILEIVFLAEERGEAIDLATVCGGDAVLERTVRALIASEPRFVRTRAAHSTESGAEARGEFPLERVGEYRLLRRLGSGAMGTVWLAEQESLGRRVAVKILHARTIGDEPARRRFLREAQAAAVLAHPNVVPIYGVGEEEGWAWIAMRWLSGPALHELRQPLGSRGVARIGAAVARALDEAHLAGVVHRDIKPANIILDDDVPFVVDFGLARAQTDSTLTRANAVPGTLPYVAPELFRGDRRALDPRTDVYALGATLYELLRGEPPFQGSDPERVIGRILLEDPPPLRLARDEQDLETIVLRALEKDPERRFQTARELADELERFHAGQPIRSRRTSWFGRSIRLARRHRKASILLALALVTASAASALLLDARIRERRVRRDAAQRAQAALDARDPVAALEILRPARAEWPHDDRIVDLCARAESAAALEALVEALLARRESILPAEVADAVTRARASGAAEREPLVCGAAIALANWHLDQIAEARDELERVRTAAGDARAVRAIEHLLRGDPHWDLAVATASSDESVLTALALRLGGRPLAEELGELARALHLDPSNERALYAHAVASANAGALGEAERILEALARRARPARGVCRDLARVRIAMGDLEGGRAALALVPDAEWTPVEAYIALDRLWQAGDVDTLRAELARASARWPAAPEVLRVAAEVTGLIDGRVEEACALLERVRRDELADFVNRDLAVYSEGRIRMHALERAGGALPAEQRTLGFEELLAWLRETGALRFEPARGLTEWLKGRALVHLARSGASLAALRTASELLPAHPGPRLDFALAVAARLRAREPSDVAVPALVCEAREHLRALLERVDRGEARLAPAEHRRALETAILLAREQSDARAIARLAAELLPALDEGSPAEAYYAELLRQARDDLEALDR